MERKLSVERLYTLGDYKNIKFTNEISSIPEELASNNGVTSLLFAQQYISCEIAYRKYVEMLEKISEDYTVMKNGKRIADPEAVMQFLEEQKNQTMKELYEELKKTYEKLPAKEVEK